LFITFSLSSNTSYFFLDFEKRIKSGPAIVSDTKRVETNIINTTSGINDRNIHKIPGSVSIGIKAEIVVRVPIIIGDLYSLSAIRTAVLGLYH
jgi:hypothetical protein